MISRGVFYVVTAILFMAGVLLITYQHIVFEVPFLPNEERQMWTVEARILSLNLTKMPQLSFY